MNTKQKKKDSQLSQSCLGIKQTKPWNVIIWHYLQSNLHSLHNNHKQAWDSSMTSLKHILNDILEAINDTNNTTFTPNNIWYLQIIRVILKNVSDTAITLHSTMEDTEDIDINTNSNTICKRDVIVQSVNKIMLLFRTMTADSVDPNRNNINSRITLSHGLFFTVNQVIRLSDILNNTVFLSPALSEIDKFKSIWTSFPLSDVVTHLYYKGRFNFQRGGQNLYQAKEDLEYAYKLCNNTSLNKIRILLLLIPIKIIFGQLPDLNKMDKVLRDRFFPIIEALKTGNLLLFKKAMNFYEDDFINCGIYLLLDKLEILVFRACVQKVHFAKQRMEFEKKKNVINLGEIKKAIQIRNKQYYASEWNKMFDTEKKSNDNDGDIDDLLLNDIDDNEIECMLSTLIYKKLMTGYIAHNIACVMSRKKAFPSIKTCKGWWINDF